MPTTDLPHKTRAADITPSTDTLQVEVEQEHGHWAPVTRVDETDQTVTLWLNKPGDHPAWWDLTPDTIVNTRATYRQPAESGEEAARRIRNAIEGVGMVNPTSDPFVSGQLSGLYVALAAVVDQPIAELRAAAGEVLADISLERALKRMLDAVLPLPTVAERMAAIRLLHADQQDTLVGRQCAGEWGPPCESDDDLADWQRAVREGRRPA